MCPDCRKKLDNHERRIRRLERLLEENGIDADLDEDDDPPFERPEDVLDGYRDYRRKTSAAAQAFGDDVQVCRRAQH